MTLTISANVNGTISGVEYNDMYLDAFGNIALSYDQQAILEECSQAVKTQLGEMALNTDIGIPYRATMWSGTPSTQQFTAAITNALLSIQGVLEVVSLITSQGGENEDPNTYNFTAIVRTTFGTGAVNG